MANEFNFFDQLSGFDFDRSKLGNYGTYDYNAPTANTDIDTGTNTGIETILPPIIPFINQGNDRDGGGITTFTPKGGYKSLYAKDNKFIGPQTSEEMEYYLDDIGEGTIDYEDQKILNKMNPSFFKSLLSLPAEIIEGYMKYGPLGQAKKGYAFIKEKQRVAAENQRLADEINARDAARREKEYAAQGRSDPTDQSRTGSLGRRPGSGGNVTATSANTNKETGTTYDSGGREGFGYGLKDGGRIRYGKGGIVTL